MAKKKDREDPNSPDMGQGLGAEGSGVGEQGQLEIPPVMGEEADLGADREDGVFLDDEAGPDTERPDGVASLEGFMREKGLRSPEDLIAYAKNLEKKTTELGNEARLARVAQMFPPQVPVQPRARTERQTLEIPEDPSELFTDRDKFGHFVERVQQVSTANARADFEEEQAKADYERYRQQAIRKASENPEEFERLRPTMLKLCNTPAYAKAGIDELYNAAKAEEDRQLSWLRNKLLSGVDLDQLKAVLPRARSGQISTAGGEGGSGIPSRKEIEDDIRKGILTAKLGS